MAVEWEKKENQPEGEPLLLTLDIKVSRRKNFHFLEDEKGNQVFVTGKISEMVNFLISNEIQHILLRIDGEDATYSVTITQYLGR